MKKILIIVLLVVLLVGGFMYMRHRKDLARKEAQNHPAFEVAQIIPGTYSASLQTQDGRTRTYVIHIPTGYTAEKSYPLVLVFHGGKGTGAAFLPHTKLEQKADEEGFIVVAPDGVGNSWSDGRGTTPSAQEGVDDAAFVRQLIADVQSKLPIDAKRIYATGASNGGMMTERLGCELSDVLAAIAPDVGPMASNIYDACKPSSIPVVGIQGGADPLVPIDGGTVQPEQSSGGVVVSAEKTMQKWAAVNHCNATPTVTHMPPTVDDGTSVDKYTFSGCTKTLVYYIVQGMGHGWPPAPAQAERITGATSQNINATDIFWDFFAAHPKQ